MARPSKLTDRDKAEISRRIALGESMRALAEEYKVGEATVRRNVSAHTPIIQDVATRLSKAELDLRALPVSAQHAARTLADHLNDLGRGLANVAGSGIRTAEHLSSLAEKKALRLTDTSSMEQLRDVVALTEGANRAASTGLTLMAANKSKAGQDGPTLEDLVVGKGDK